MRHFIYILFICLITQLVYSQSAESVHVLNLNPYERVTYLENNTAGYVPTNNGYVFNRITNSSTEAWEVYVYGVIGANPYFGGGYGTGSGVYDTYYKFYKDVDGDGYGDSEYYIALPAGTNVNSDLHPPSFVSQTKVEIPRTATDIDGNVYDFNNEIISCTYDGYTWVRNNLGIDCDDNNTNIPSSQLGIYFRDRDGDGIGAASYSSSGALIDYKVAPIDCEPFYLDVVPDYFHYTSLNNNDCNDFDPNVGINPINWYLDEDGDGYGNSNIFIVSCERPESNYVSLGDDCNDNDSEFNIEQITWYADFDDDGFGDESNFVISSCPVVGYVRDCYFDECPTEAGIRENGCPLPNYDFDNNNKNYMYDRTYLEAFQPENLSSATDEEVIEQITYMDGLGRIEQQIGIKITPQGNDIIIHNEYDGNGRNVKSYLPYVKENNNGEFDTNSLVNTLNYYNTPEFENTTNPFSETINEGSPFNRVLEIAAPGNDWSINLVNGVNHTIKKNDFEVNFDSQIKKFRVHHENDFIENTELVYDGTYEIKELFKSITKNENWTPNQDYAKDNTTEVFTNSSGQTVLERKYEGANGTHDTYFVYDDIGNLTYVIPPVASDQIVDAGFQGFRVASQINYPWTDLVQVNKDFAEEYNRKLSDYKNEQILNVDLENEYGGQGGFTITTLEDSEIVTLNISFTTTKAFTLKEGVLLSLKEYGSYKDTELGVISGDDFDYVFHIKGNSIMITKNGKGKGELFNINESFSSNTKLIYSYNYPWTKYFDVDPKFAATYEKDLSAYKNDEILDVQIPNDYGGQGGVNITIDENDNVSVTFTSFTTQPLKLRQGKVLPLNIERRITDRVLGTFSGTNFSYELSIRDNNITIEGAGLITQFNAVLTAFSPPEDPEVIPETVEGLCYIYHYDYRNRIVEKKIPDSGWEYILYDNLDRPVMFQNAKQRTQNEWSFVKYDQLGRTAYEGILKSYYGRPAIKLTIENADLYEEKLETPNNINGTEIYYSNSIPLSETGEIEVLKVNYYDDYNFDDDGLATNPTSVFGQQVSNNIEILPTATKVKVLETNDWMTYVTYYDDNGRAIYNANKNQHLNASEVIELKYDFVGRVIKKKTTHTKDNVPMVVVDNYDYDKLGRLLTQTETINNSQEELISNNSYSELGQLISKAVGGDVAVNPETSSGLQNVDYAYNVRGWLTSINEGQTNGNDLFGLKLNYNTVDDPNATPLFNGNISELYWQTANDNNLRGYDYEYDVLNRIKSGNYHSVLNDDGTNTNDENFSLSGITYDKLGNIITLQRYGFVYDSNGANVQSIDLIDNLTYNYAPISNTLMSINDSADAINGNSVSFGFNDKNTAEDDYSYDELGNMVIDKNKGIVNIAYNHLNLPTQITIVDDQEREQLINYIYDASGRKLLKTITHDTGNTVITTETAYAGQAIYTKSSLDQSSTFKLKLFSQPEGYIEPNSAGSFDYVYQYKDHLGNVRLTYKNIGTANSPNLEILSENNFYPFGLTHKGYNGNISANANDISEKFKFNGIELETSFNLNLYEMPLRQYDPAIARWTSIDPVTHFSMSTYTGFDNNPVYWSDPSGANAQDFDYENDYDQDYYADAEPRHDPNNPEDVEFMRQFNLNVGLDEVLVIAYLGRGDHYNDMEHSGENDFDLLDAMIVMPFVMYDIADQYLKSKKDNSISTRSGSTITGNGSDNLTEPTTGTIYGMHHHEELGFPGGGGAQLTRWKHLSNNLDNVMDAARDGMSAGGHINNGFVEPWIEELENPTIGVYENNNQILSSTVTPIDTLFIVGGRTPGATEFIMSQTAREQDSVRQVFEDNGYLEVTPSVKVIYGNGN